MTPRWKKYLSYGSLVIFGGMLLFLLEETVRLKNTGFEPKTLWDWMELLVIPLVLAIGAFFLNRSERELDRKQAEDRAQLERDLATDRQQEAALQAYLDRMADLLLKEDLRNTENEAVRDVARIRTLTVLRGLDARRKGIVIKFLYEANLINRGKPVIELQGADLRGADLSGTTLASADLMAVDLSEGDLSYAFLASANLGGANLARADLQTANLTAASLVNANLKNAKLQDAILADTVLKQADLSGAILRDAFLSTDLQFVNLDGATMPDGTIHK